MRKAEGKRYKGKTALVYDNGLFVETATVLTRDFDKVYYFCPWISGYPNSNPLWIGRGIPGVQRITNIWEVEPEVDLWIFPDVYDGPLQQHLVSMGKRVWGSRLGEQLELNREVSKQLQDDLGIAIGPYEVVTGVNKLRAYLREHEDQYVKISATRGDMETFYSKNYKLIEPRLNELAHRLGAKASKIEFIVEDAINDAVEVGYDGFCIDGEFPSHTLYGIEIKDKGYIGRVKAYDDLPEQVRDVNERFAPVLRNFNYRNFWSAELRITEDGTAYSIDPCARFGSPPSELFGLMMENIADVLWEGAEGNLVEPSYLGEWAAELLIHSTWAGERNWQAVEFPEEIRGNVKLRNLSIIDGKHYVVPDPAGMPEIGAVVVYGDTQEDVVKQCRQISEKVEGYLIQLYPDALDEAQNEIKQLEDFGIDF